MWNNMSNVRREEKELDLKVRHVEALERIAGSVGAIEDLLFHVEAILEERFLEEERLLEEREGGKK
jgi:hypothetical protein